MRRFCLTIEKNMKTLEPDFSESEPPPDANGKPGENNAGKIEEILKNEFNAKEVNPYG